MDRARPLILLLSLLSILFGVDWIAWNATYRSEPFDPLRVHLFRTGIDSQFQLLAAAVMLAAVPSSWRVLATLGCLYGLGYLATGGRHPISQMMVAVIPLAAVWLPLFVVTNPTHARLVPQDQDNTKKANRFSISDLLVWTVVAACAIVLYQAGRYELESVLDVFAVRYDSEDIARMVGSNFVDNLCLAVLTLTLLLVVTKEKNVGWGGTVWTALLLLPAIAGARILLFEKLDLFDIGREPLPEFAYGLSTVLHFLLVLGGCWTIRWLGYRLKREVPRAASSDPDPEQDPA